MKATYRAKYNALCAINDGHSFITIRRYNSSYIVYLDDILTTANGKKVPEHEETRKYEVATLSRLYNKKELTFKDLMNYNK